MTVIVACVRDSSNQNNGLGWRCEVITKFKDTPKTFQFEFDGRVFRLERFTTKGEDDITHWSRRDDCYHFNLCVTARQLWRQVRAMVDYGHTRADRRDKWLNEEKQKVKDLKDEVRLLRKEDREWSPIEEEK